MTTKTKKRTYYAEICVWIEATSEKEAREIAEQAAERAEDDRDITSATVNSVEDDGGAEQSEE